MHKSKQVILQKCFRRSTWLRKTCRVSNFKSWCALEQKVAPVSTFVLKHPWKSFYRLNDSGACFHPEDVLWVYSACDVIHVCHAGRTHDWSTVPPFVCSIGRPLVRNWRTQWEETTKLGGKVQPRLQFMVHNETNVKGAKLYLLSRHGWVPLCYW